MIILNYLGEIWKDIPNYEGLYQVSNLGRVKSMDRVVNHHPKGTAIKKGKILKQQLTKNGYYAVILKYKCNSQYCLVHRLVWVAFNGEISEGYQVNHINEDKTDNRLENLNLLTPKDNINWGKHNSNISDKLSITVIQYSLDDLYIKEWKSANEIKRETGYSQGNINSCCLGKRKTAYGYKWKYK